VSRNTIDQHKWQNRQSKDSEILLDRVICEGITQSRQSAYQAHWSFMTAMLLSTASAAIGLSGASLLLLGHASEGSVTAAVGLASGVYSHQLSKDAADRQRQANERLDHMLQELHAAKHKT
jgi:FtsH-binding integral membrane protein